MEPLNELLVRLNEEDLGNLVIDLGLGNQFNRRFLEGSVSAKLTTFQPI